MIPARNDTPETTPDDPTDAVDAGAPAKRRPVRRSAKPDAVLAAAVDFAREGILQVAPAEQVGGHVTSYPEGERLTTHRFEAFVPGYGNWHWFITLARVARSKEPTICEVGLLPSETALLAPEWLPWSERVRPEDHEDAAGAASGDAAGSGDAVASGGVPGEEAVEDQGSPAAPDAPDPAPAGSVSERSPVAGAGDSNPEDSTPEGPESGHSNLDGSTSDLPGTDGSDTVPDDGRQAAGPTFAAPPPAGRDD
ncbi:DUF3027 domain-containing protein [Arthrobacter sp. TMN-37]